MSAEHTRHLISRLSNAAAYVSSQASAQEAVRSAFTELLKLASPDVVVFLADVLHGNHGRGAAAVAWRNVIGRGIVIAGEGTSNPLRTPLAAYCMFLGRMDLVREIVMRDVFPPVQADLIPTNRAQLLMLLCTTTAGRRGSTFDELEKSCGLVRFAAANAVDCPFAVDALELAWDVDQYHDGFFELAEELSEGGAFVRSFVLGKRIASVHVDDVDRRSPDLPFTEMRGAPVSRRTRRVL